MKNAQLVITLSLVALMCATAPSLAAPAQSGLLMQHDYFAASGLSDVSGNGRDGTLGSLATLTAPNGGAGFVDLPGGLGSSVLIDVLGTGAQNLAQLSEANGGDATIEIWLDFDSSNAIGTEDGNSRINFFHASSTGGSNTALYYDFRQADPLDHDLGGNKDSDIISGVHRGGDAARSRVEGAHQWVYVFDGNFDQFNPQDGTWAIFRDGVLAKGDPNGAIGEPLSSNLYKSSLGANPYTLAGGPAELAVGGETAMGGGADPTTGTVGGVSNFGDSPTGKMYRALFYDEALTAQQVSDNFDDGVAAGIPLSGGGLPCDFSSDDICNQTDIDLIAAAVRNMTSDSQFNVDGVGDPNVPDNNDFNFYITNDTMIGTGHGDANLDFLVNFVDFVNLSNNFGSSGTGWLTGNFNTDDVSNFNDFVLLSNNFGISFVSGSNVPEPASLGVITLITLSILRRRSC